MPATFTVQSVRSNNGIQQVHLSLDHGQPNEIWFNVKGEVLAMIFGEDVQEGDTRDVRAPLRMRAGTNGKRSG